VLPSIATNSSACSEGVTLAAPYVCVCTEFSVGLVMNAPLSTPSLNCSIADSSD